MPQQRFTSFRATYGLINPTAAQDVIITTNGAQSFCTPTNLVTKQTHTFEYITMEQNFGVLDGSLSILPDSINDVSCSYISSIKSNNDGTFDTSPEIYLNFSKAHASFGLTFNFCEDYPLEFECIVLDEDELYHTYVVTCDELTKFVRFNVGGYTSITVRFTKTLPNRYIKLNYILFGSGIAFDESVVSSADLTLETDVISDKISINELSMEVIDTLDDYNLANDNGLHQYLAKSQELKAYEQIDNEELFLGKYFLDSYSVTNNKVKMTFVSYLGLLDTTQFNEGEIYVDTKAGTILDKIFSVGKINNDEYTIDDETYNTLVTGTIAPMTCREAIREVLFACGSTIETFSLDGIVIKKQPEQISDRMTRSQKISTSITKQDYVNAVEVKYSVFAKSTKEADKIVEDIYESGEQTVTFDSPYTDIKVYINSGTSQNPILNEITPSKIMPYYVVFTLEEEQNIIIKGVGYDETKITTRVENTDSSVDVPEYHTVKSYTTTLCNAKMAKEKALKILNYLSSELKLKIQWIADDIEFSNRKLVENSNNNYSDYIAWYTARNLDLTGGFIDTCTMVGYYYNDYNYAYAGVAYTDGDIDIYSVYAGEDLGLI